MIGKHSQAVATSDSILIMTTLSDNSRDLLPAVRYCTWLFAARRAMKFSLRWHLARGYSGMRTAKALNKANFCVFNFSRGWRPSAEAEKNCGGD